MSKCTINKKHCEQCGNTDPEDIEFNTDDGYSACCNEIVVWDSRDCRGHHIEDDHDYEPDDRRHPMHTDPSCKVCGLSKH